MMIATPKEFTMAFVKSEQLAQDTFCFFFDRRGTDFDFLPGQWVRMVLSLKQPDERGTSRVFSIASSPLENHLMIVTRIIQSPFKKKLMVLSPSEEISFFGPAGRFVLNESETRPHVFLAGGVGITPFRSMLMYASEKNLSIPITFLASFSTIEDVIFYQEFSTLAGQHVNVAVVYTVTQPEQSRASWNGEMERISENLIRKYVPNIADSLYYIAGPPAMVSEVEGIVKGMGVSQENIRKEHFVGY